MKRVPGRGCPRCGTGKTHGQSLPLPVAILCHLCRVEGGCQRCQARLLVGTWLPGGDCCPPKASPDVPNDGMFGFLLPEKFHQEAAHTGGMGLELLLFQDIQNSQPHSTGHRTAPKLSWTKDKSVLQAAELPHSPPAVARAQGHKPGVGGVLLGPL